MEFGFPVSRLLRDTITKLNANACERVSGKNLHQLTEIVDKLGYASAKAQGLHSVITTFSKLRVCRDHMYVLRDGQQAVGFIRVGKKKLFVRDDNQAYVEIEPLCVLDFYVHESKQRSGFGKKLMEGMLQHEGVKPHRLAYDRPSFKYLAFLKKHYALSNYRPQDNNFVIFKKYFEEPIEQPLDLMSRSTRAAQRRAASASSQGTPSTPAGRPSTQNPNERRRARLNEYENQYMSRPQESVQNDANAGLEVGGTGFASPAPPQHQQSRRSATAEGTPQRPVRYDVFGNEIKTPPQSSQRGGSDVRQAMRGLSINTREEVQTSAVRGGFVEPTVQSPTHIRNASNATGQILGFGPGSPRASPVPQDVAGTVPGLGISYSSTVGETATGRQQQHGLQQNVDRYHQNLKEDADMMNKFHPDKSSLSRQHHDEHQNEPYMPSKLTKVPQRNITGFQGFGSNTIGAFPNQQSMQLDSHMRHIEKRANIQQQRLDSITQQPDGHTSGRSTTSNSWNWKSEMIRNYNLQNPPTSYVPSSYERNAARARGPRPY
eukprot:GFYU01017124.1.p1 GENE.GFYU01017124.1~~GFYU01017124.1.p1  ORF type:complete len:546 (+),score=69.97 GFYU01017124.1:84-1721(+)